MLNSSSVVLLRDLLLRLRLLEAISCVCVFGVVAGEVVQAEPLPGGLAVDRSSAGFSQIPAATLPQFAPIGTIAAFPPNSQATAPLPPSLAPVLPPQPQYATEEALIQQLSGGNVGANGANNVGANNAGATATPIFRPPGATVWTDGTAPAPLPPMPSPAVPLPQRPTQVTAGTNSDLGIRLIDPPDRPANSLYSPTIAPLPTGTTLEFNADRALPRPTTNAVTPASGAITPEAPGSSLPPLPVAPTASPSQEVRPLPAPGIPGGLPLQRPIRNAALTPAALRFQGVYVYQGNDSSARARLSGIYPISPNLLFGATLDLVDGNAFADSREQGLNINELFLAASLRDAPNVRLVLGRLDLTSYFDRNSFAKDGASQFFNGVFQTNPALAVTGISSRQAALVNWTVSDSLEAKAAVFSSSPDLGDFDVSGFAGEIGLRYGNFIIRGTYATDRDAGQRDSFREIFQVDRGNGRTGVFSNDREEAYGINAEVFVPELRLGVFARYGSYYNRDADKSGDTYSAGISFLDLLTPNDRLGIGYGRNLSNDQLRSRSGNKEPDVFEVYYDFAALPNIRLGFSYQAFENFTSSIFGVRVRTELDVVPRR